MNTKHITDARHSFFFLFTPTTCLFTCPFILSTLVAFIYQNPRNDCESEKKSLSTSVFSRAYFRCHRGGGISFSLPFKSSFHSSLTPTAAVYEFREQLLTFDDNFRVLIKLEDNKCCTSVGRRMVCLFVSNLFLFCFLTRIYQSFYATCPNNN